MWSKPENALEPGSRPLLQLVRARPWLCGTALLAVATAGLFAWFFTQQWDEVEVSVRSARHDGLVNGSAELAELDVASNYSHFEQLPPDFAANEHRDESETRFAAHRPLAPPFDPAMTAPAAAGGTGVRPVSAQAVEPAAVSRGAWLTGTIEEIADEQHLRRPDQLASPGRIAGPNGAPW